MRTSRRSRPLAPTPWLAASRRESPSGSKAPRLPTASQPPYSSERTLRLCRAFSRGIVRVEDAEILDALRALFSTMRLAVEPAAPAALAGVRGPLRDQIRRKRVGIVLCGSNIDPRAYAHFLTVRGHASYALDEG